MNKTIAILLSISLCLGTLAMTAGAADKGLDLSTQTIYSGSCGTGLSWSYDSTNYTLSITGTGDMADYTSSGDVPWYGYRNNITKIIIGDGVRSIGDKAFYYCSYITGIVLPNSLEAIGSRAFYNCSSLQNIILGTGLRTVGEYAFYGCSSLAKVLYRGSAVQWGSVSIGGNNSYLSSASLEYNFANLLAGKPYTVDADATANKADGGNYVTDSRYRGDGVNYWDGDMAVSGVSVEWFGTAKSITYTFNLGSAADIGEIVFRNVRIASNRGFGTVIVNGSYTFYSNEGSKIPVHGAPLYGDLLEEQYFDIHLPIRLTDVTELTVTIITDMYVCGYDEIEAYGTSTGDADVWDGSIATGFGGGSGTSSNPYLIKTASQLAYLASRVNNGYNYSGSYFRLDTNIDLNSREWTPIGTSESFCFCGCFNGNGKVISNLKIRNSRKGAGLFGYIDGGCVENLGLSNVDVDVSYGSAYSSAGGLAGEVKNADIEKCFVTGSVKCQNTSASGSVDVGGLIGQLDDGTHSIKNCFAVVTVYGSTTGFNAYVGGLIGVVGSSTTDGTIENCYANAQVSAVNLTSDEYAAAGGLIGDLWSSVTVRNCFATGNVYADAYSSYYEYKGAFLGHIYSSYGSLTKNNCYYGGSNVNDSHAISAGSSSFASQSWLSGVLGWNFSTVWSLSDDGAPVLKQFAGLDDDFGWPPEDESSVEESSEESSEEVLEYEEIALNSSVSVYLSGGDTAYYRYTPVTDGSYVIYSIGDADTRVYLYSEDGTSLDSDDDGGAGSNFRMEYDFVAGTRYIFAVKYYYSSASGTINFNFGRMYTVSYDANGGSGAPASQSKDYGADLTLSSVAPTRTNYIFRGWGTSSDSASASYNVGDSYTNNGNITLYALWQPIYDTLTVNSSDSASLSAGTSKTYMFTPTESGRYVIYSTGDSDTVVTLRNINGFYISGDDDSGEGRNFCLEQELTAGTSYLFQLEYYHSSASGTINFKFGRVYTVSYHAGGGSGAPANQSKYYGADLSLSTSIPVREGYIFDGWSSSATASVADYQAGDTYSANQSISLYALWRVANLVLGRQDYTLSSSDGTVNYGGDQYIDGVCPPVNVEIDYTAMYSGQVTDGVYNSADDGATVMLACPNRTHTYTFPLGGMRSVYSVVVRSATLYGNKCMNVVRIELSADGLCWHSVPFEKAFISLDSVDGESLFDIVLSFDTYNASYVRLVLDSTNPGNSYYPFEISYNGSNAKGQYASFQEIEVIGNYNTDGIDLATGRYGDVSNDGIVNSLDAAQVLKYDASLIMLEEGQLTLADVNGDGVVNSLDAAQILKYDALLIDNFPVEG